MDALGSWRRQLPDAAFVDLFEREDAYLLVLDVPGADAAATAVTVEDGRLQIKARREKAVDDDYRYRREGRPLYHDRTLPLPPGVDPSGIDAGVENGVLEVLVPKAGAD
jgi:HSP20 family molecular chaperone IbpA